MKREIIRSTKLFFILGLTAGFSCPVVAQQTAATATAPNEVLATAPFKNGEGRIEIRRVIEEDGSKAVAIVRAAPIGTHYEPRREWASLPLAEQVNRAYEHLTGQMLTREAYLALQDLEELKLRSAAIEAMAPLSALTNPIVVPSSGCGFKIIEGGGFHYDCKVYGPISREMSGIDDVCLLTAAIVGDHKMQITYKTSNGYNENFSSNVTQGHFVATQLLTGVRKTRRGQIYYATDSEYSRYSFDGDSTLEIFFDPNITECQTVTSK